MTSCLTSVRCQETSPANRQRSDGPWHGMGPPPPPPCVPWPQRSACPRRSTCCRTAGWTGRARPPPRTAGAPPPAPRSGRQGGRPPHRGRRHRLGFLIFVLCLNWFSKLPPCLPPHPPTDLPIYPPNYQPTYLPACLPPHLPNYPLPACLQPNLPNYLPAHACSSACLPPPRGRCHQYSNAGYCDTWIM